jgi:GGDEF domain-containing protein
VVYTAAAGAIVLTALMVAVSRRRHRRNEYEVRHDTLTGLGNRTLLAEQTRRVLSAWDTRRCPTCPRCRCVR